MRDNGERVDEVQRYHRKTYERHEEKKSGKRRWCKEVVREGREEEMVKTMESNKYLGWSDERGPEGAKKSRNGEKEE